MKAWIQMFSAAVIAALITFALMDHNTELLEQAEAQSPPPSPQLPVVKPGEPLPSNLFVELAKVVNPSVVNIATSQNPRPMRGFPQGRGRDPMLEFFEQFMGPQFMQPMRPVQSLGTGFIIREDGLIVTNNHVIDRADIIKVQLSEDSKDLFDAEIVGKDERTDIALIKINAKRKLPAIKMGSSQDVQVGEWVAAFGNPFGHGHTMTKGIISAKGRSITELNRFPFLQTDASINPGNSGGPLVNTAGQVIGVNTAIDARAQGIGFAIPIDSVKQILPELEKNGSIKRGYIGVSLAELTPESAEALGLKDDAGAIVAQLVPGGPAERAGLKPYDVVVQFNGRDVKSVQDLMDAVADSKIDSKPLAKVMRNGKSLSLNVQVSEHPDSRRSAKKTYSGQKAPFDLGFRIADYSPQIAQEFNLPALNQKRPVVIDIEPNSPAARSGLSPGDIVLDINRTSVSTATEVLRALQNDKVNMIRVLRGPTVAILYLGR